MFNGDGNMVKMEILKNLIGKYIVVGVPHNYKENQLFFHDGILEHVDDEDIVLKKDEKTIIISIDMIKQLMEE